VVDNGDIRAMIVLKFVGICQSCFWKFRTIYIYIYI